MDPSALYSAPEHQTYTLGEGTRRALLLHGFPGTPAELRGVAALLRDLGWQATVPLLPGFGLDMPRLGEQRYTDWTDAALSYWEMLQAGATETLLLGFSMGGAVALHLTSRLAPVQSPNTLVLLAPFWRMTDRRAALLPLAKRVMPQLRPFAQADFSDPVVRAQFARRVPGADLDDPAIQDRLRRDLTLPTSALDELRKLGRAAYRAAGQANVPTLVLQGVRDTTVTPADTRALLVRLPGPLTLCELDADHDFVKPHGAGYAAALDRLRLELSPRLS